MFCGLANIRKFLFSRPSWVRGALALVLALSVDPAFGSSGEPVAGIDSLATAGSGPHRPRTESEFEVIYNRMMGWDDCVRELTKPLPSQLKSKYPCAVRLKWTQGSKAGQWKEPDPGMVRALKGRILQPLIPKIAEEYGIDARALAGVVLTEQSVNQTGPGSEFDKWIDRMAKKHGAHKVLAMGHQIGIKLSLGLAQFNVDGICHTLAVRQAIEPDFYPEMSCKDGKLRGNGKSLIGLLNTVNSIESSLRWVAASLRHAQDEYAAVGCDISQDLGALLTVHVLGHARELASNSACKRGENPNWNFMGLWAEKHRDVIYSLLPGDYQPKIASSPAVSIPPPPRFDRILSRSESEELFRLLGRLNLSPPAVSTAAGTDRLKKPLESGEATQLGSIPSPDQIAAQGASH